jgi:hypothetical protein
MDLDQQPTSSFVIKCIIKRINDKWIPWNNAKDFFEYGATQMSVLQKK